MTFVDLNMASPCRQSKDTERSFLVLPNPAISEKLLTAPMLQVCDDTKQANLHSDSDAKQIFETALNTDQSFTLCAETLKVDFATLPGPVVHKDDSKCYANKDVNCDVATRSDKLRPLCYCKNG